MNARKIILITLGLIVFLFVLFVGAIIFWFGYYCNGRMQYCYRLYKRTLNGVVLTIPPSQRADWYWRKELTLDEVTKRM